MAEKTGIGWTHHTFNIAWGCEKVSPGCQFCYAERDSKRYGFDIWGKGKKRRLFGEKHWKEPLRWNDQALSPEFVFCSSMCDVYEDHPDIISQLPKLWSLIRGTRNLYWQILTKRANRIHQWTPIDILLNQRVLFGVSAENQEQWDLRVPFLWELPLVSNVFVSAEPLLGPINPTELSNLNWLIIGGESGTHRRECNPDWITNLTLIAMNEHVPVFVKQDSGLKPGQQGRIPKEIWNMKQMPQMKV